MAQDLWQVHSLSNLENNLPEGVHRIKCKFGHDDKKYETYGIKYKYYNCFLEYLNFKDELINYKYLCCNKSFQHKFDEKSKEQFFLIHTNFLTTTKIRLFYCCEKLFILLKYK